MKAVIMAAGYGSRLMPFTKDQPKCLLPVSNGESMLARQIRILRKLNVHHIIIITGYKKEKIIKTYSKEKNVATIFNPQFQTTGDAFSLWMARERFDDDLVLLNGDVVFTELTIKELLDDRRDFLLSVIKKECELDDVKVEVQEGRIVNVGKGIPLQKAYGEAVGIGKIRKEKLKAYSSVLGKSIQKNSQIRWAEVFNDLMAEGEEINFTLVKEHCIENDTIEDYRRTKKLFAEQRERA